MRTTFYGASTGEPRPRASSRSSIARTTRLSSSSAYRGSSRYDRINEFENNLVDGGTIVLKFYLHISENEQLERFAKRLDDPTRRWKISEADYADRKLWPAYIDAYEDVFRKTSTKHAPWFIIPANHKWFRNLAVSTIIVQAMESLALELPKPSVDIDEIRKKYHSAKKNKRGTGKQTRKKT
jgi:polyphosphate kinase 2 (PPK2 family)